MKKIIGELSPLKRELREMRRLLIRLIRSIPYLVKIGKFDADVGAALVNQYRQHYRRVDSFDACATEAGRLTRISLYLYEKGLKCTSKSKSTIRFTI